MDRRPKRVLEPDHQEIGRRRAPRVESVQQCAGDAGDGFVGANAYGAVDKDVLERVPLGHPLYVSIPTCRVGGVDGEELAAPFTGDEKAVVGENEVGEPARGV
jgi:hypothetical protein